MKINLSIIIVSYNTKQLLGECLRSIYTLHPKTYTLEIIVVDNSSVDESVSMVKKDFPKVKLIENKENFGFAKANNLGIEKASGQYILFLNPDTIVLKETLETMVKFIDEHPEVGATTCRVELPNGKLDQACHRGFPTPWNSFCYFTGLSKLFPKSKFFASYSLTYLPLNIRHEIDAGSGAFLLVRRKAGENVGWWDEDYFWYGEDLDFCYRLKQKAWKIMFVPDVKIIHYKGAASGIKKHSQKMSTATPKTKVRAAKASVEAMRIFYRKHYQNKYPKFVYWLAILGINLLEKARLKRYENRH